MKRNLKLFALLFGLVILSCTKDDDDNTTNFTVTGLWIGTYTTDQFPQNPPLYQNFVIKPDGKMLTEGKVGSGATYYSAGTWTLVNDTLRCTYTTINFPNVTVTQSAKFYYNKANGTLSSGTWRDEQNGSNYTGKFQNMTEVN